MRLKYFNEYINEEEKLEYKFHELPPDGKQNALEKNADFNIGHEWWISVYEGFIEDMNELGVTIEKDDINFSGFSSQGDGASFTTKSIDTKIFMSKALDIKSNAYYDDGSEPDKEDELQQLVGDLKSVGFDSKERLGPDDITFEIYRTDNQHVHERSVEVSVEFDAEDAAEVIEEEYRNFDEFRKKLYNNATDWQIKTCKELYSKLNADHNHLTSEKEITDSLVSNDYDFDIEGNII